MKQKEQRQTEAAQRNLIYAGKTMEKKLAKAGRKEKRKLINKVVAVAID